MFGVRRIGYMWSEYCVILLLVWNARQDLRQHEVSIPSLGIFAAAGILVNLLLKYQSSLELLTGIGSGVFVLAAAAVTRGAIGFGDGLLLCVTGIYLGGSENMQLLMAGLLLCALVLGAGLILGKAGWKQQFPFVPFLCLAQFGRMLWKVV